MKPDLLKGIRIIDFTTYVAAPGAGRIMADWGADVIKVEGLSGDPMRNFGVQMGIPATDDVNPIWELENGNKRGITLDLKNPKGMEIMMKLLESADGMTSNVRLGSLKKMGLDYETLSKKFPKLVWGHVSGYGIYGEEAPRPGYDVVSFWARGGFLADTPTIGHPPMTTPFGVGDHTASLVLLGGMLAGIMKAKATGQGEKVVLSLQGTSIWVNGLMALSTQFGDVYPKDRYAPPTPFSNSYQCKDGEWIVLTILQYERYFKAFCEALEIPEYVDDVRYNTTPVFRRPPLAPCHFSHPPGSLPGAMRPAARPRCGRRARQIYSFERRTPCSSLRKNNLPSGRSPKSMHRAPLRPWRTRSTRPAGIPRRTSRGWWTSVSCS